MEKRYVAAALLLASTMMFAAGKGKAEATGGLEIARLAVVADNSDYKRHNKMEAEQRKHQMLEKRERFEAKRLAENKRREAKLRAELKAREVKRREAQQAEAAFYEKRQQKQAEMAREDRERHEAWLRKVGKSNAPLSVASRP